MAELRFHRELWRDDGDNGQHFYVEARGGGRTKAREGVASDCVAVFCREHSRLWCE